jgi:hypothetical protein
MKSLIKGYGKEKRLGYTGLDHRINPLPQWKGKRIRSSEPAEDAFRFP